MIKFNLFKKSYLKLLTFMLINFQINKNLLFNKNLLKCLRFDQDILLGSYFSS